VEQDRDLTNRNRIRGISGRTSGRLIAKSISISDQCCRSGRGAGEGDRTYPGRPSSRSDIGTEGTAETVSNLGGHAGRRKGRQARVSARA
jgi:hypothetical protein